MSHHDHHESSVEGVNSAETEKLKKEAKEAGSTSVGYFLGKAAESQTQKERDFWLGKVDSARYFAERKKVKEKLSASAIRNMEADIRLMETESSLELVRTVGNACVLKLIKGKKEPTDGWRLQSGGTDYGRPMGNQWVVQNLKMDVTYHFHVSSEDAESGKNVTGPVLEVPIGNVSTAEINKKQKEQAEAEHAAREAARLAKEKELEEQRAAERAAQAEAIKRQEAEAAKERAEMDKRIKDQKEAHDKAVRELPLTGPQNLKIKVKGLRAKISFEAGSKRCLFFRFTLNGSVLGAPPDGRYNGKRAGHKYRRTVVLNEGTNTIEVASVTNHGDHEETRTVEAAKKKRWFGLGR